jgi:hypothetical protein
MAVQTDRAIAGLCHPGGVLLMNQHSIDVRQYSSEDRLEGKEPSARKFR